MLRRSSDTTIAVLVAALGSIVVLISFSLILVLVVLSSADIAEVHDFLRRVGGILVSLLRMLG